TATINVNSSSEENAEEVIKYRYKLNSNEWSEEYDIDTPISLSNLSVGTQILLVEGKDAVRNFQTEPTQVSWEITSSSGGGGGGGSGGGGGGSGGGAAKSQEKKSETTEVVDSPDSEIDITRTLFT